MSEDRYEFKGKIGEGGVGAVYRAFDTQLNREVAIKRVLADGGFEDQEEATKNLLKEATALSSVQHPNIVTIYDAGIDEDGPYVVMELINGRTLDEMVEETIMAWDDLREVIVQSQEALIAAQDLDLVHRDLKPSNLMICWLPSGKFQVKIVDFGLAKFSASPSLQTIDHGDAVFGSIFFMAPEQFERTPLDKRTDMYALGCLYYYALTGKHPFTGDSAAEVMVSHLQHHVIPLIELRPDIPQWAADWIMWHLERQMDQRPMDAHEALKRFLALEKQATQPVPTAKLRKATSPVTPVTASQTANPISVAKTSSAPITLATATTPTATPIAAPAADPTAANLLVKPQAVPVEPSPAPTLKVQPAPAQSSAAIVKPVATTQLKAATPASASAKLAAKPMTAQPSTPGNESQRPEDSGLGFESAKKTMPTGAKWALISMLLVVIVVTAIVGTSVMDERKYTQMVNDVMVKAKALDDEDKLGIDGIELTEEELRGTLDRATSMDENKQQAILLKTLLFAKATGGYDADAIILDHTLTAKCPSSIRAGLFQDVIKYRSNPDNIPALLKFARNSTEEDEAAGALIAVRYSLADQEADHYLKDLLNLIKATESAKVRMAAERAAHAVISKSGKKAGLEPDIYDIYKNTTDNSIKFTMLRLLGTTGEDMAMDAIDDALESGEPTNQAAAIAALAKWKNDDQFPTLIEFIKNKDNKALRGKAFTNAHSFLGIEREREPDQLRKLWTSLADTAQTQTEKRKIINGMAQLQDQWSIEILGRYIKDGDDKIIDAAERAIAQVQEKLSNPKKEAVSEDE